MCKISVEKRMFKWIWGKNRKYRIKNELIRKHLGVSSIDDKLRDSFEMIWTCQTPTQASNGADEEKFFYASWWPIKEKGVSRRGHGWKQHGWI